MKKLNLAFLCIVALIFTNCSHKKPVKTIENLKTAITGESNASSKYALFALKAREEGFDTIAKMFYATSRAEFIHSIIHTVVLKKLGFEFTPTIDSIKPLSTQENLKAAIEGETYEFSEMYPEFIKVAKEEGVSGADSTFNWAMGAEKKHKDFYQKALETITKSTKETGLPTMWAVCPRCGNTFFEGTIEKYCSFCKSPENIFIPFKIKKAAIRSPLH